jgi:uncharacterized membrane protein
VREVVVGMTAEAQRTVPVTTAPTAHSPRWAVVDLSRGIAIVAVVAFHLTWDLGDLGLISWRISAHWSGKVIAHIIAGSFLFLVGVSLVLAHRRGIRWRSFRRRESQLVALALVITAFSAIYQPREVVTFGILHAIALVSLIALTAVLAPRWVPWALAIVAVALPWLLHLPGRSPWVSWTGLADGTQPSLDWQPVLPWIALTFVGIGVMRSLLDADEEVATVASVSGVSQVSGEELTTVASVLPRSGISGEEVTTVASVSPRSGISGEEVATVAKLRGWRPAGGPLSWLGVLGRHTLAIYVIHQPVLYGVLWLVA